MDICLNQILLLVLMVTLVEGQADFCVSPNPAPTGRALPFISASYQTHVEVKILDQNYSMSVDEYLDNDGNRGVINIYMNGNTQNLIFSYETNEVFDINEDRCTVYSIKKSPYSFMFGPTNTTGKPHIYDGPNSLRFTPNNNPVYNSTGTVRGIPADIWTACLPWPGATGHIRATYYFSVAGWNTSSPSQIVPLRVEVEGYTSQSLTGGSKPAPTLSTPRHFHHIYDFIGYIPYIDADPYIFQTPPEIVCANRTSEKSLPTFKTHFKYKAEVVDTKDSSITHYAIWYDEYYKLVREDTRIIDPTSGNPVSTTEIHDFNTEVRYIMSPDKDCVVESIDPSLADTDVDVSRLRFNGSLYVDMRDPNSFFVSNYNYTYTGWRIIRGMNCDIYSTSVPNYELNGVLFNAIFEYAFLTDGWTDIPLYTTELDVHNYPVQLAITIPSQLYTRVYNFFEFSEDNVTYPTYDISSCFDETQKLGFQIIFPGAFDPSLMDAFTTQVYDTLLSVMQVYPARIGGITITYDADSVYANAYVLAPSVKAQFNFTGPTLEQANDKTIKGITTMEECAALCVDNTDFICLGFQYCPSDGFACRLGKKHIPSHGPFLNSSACNEYSRLVTVARKREPLIQEAYNSLHSAVFGGLFKISVGTNQGTPVAPFSAIDLRIVSGKIVQDKPLPTLPTSFSYRMEIVTPKETSAQEIFVWYDENMNVARYDSKDTTSNQADYMTIVLDFNSGVASEINRRSGDCNEMPIPNSQVFDAIATETMTNGAIRLTMKTSNAFFFLDDTYTYIGEGTARGILCDVYESVRGDFNEEHTNTSNKDTVFKYYFQSSSWTYTSPQSLQPATNQPVQLNIEDKSTGEYLVYSFYDFTENSLSTTFYDTTVCFDPAETKRFIIEFGNQQYHPVLDDNSGAFLQSALNTLADLTFMSPINFQRASVSYDDSGVYIIVTILGHTTYLNLFTPIMTITHNATDDEISALSSSDCASACIQNKNFVCNSFDYCPNLPGPNCRLEAQRGETSKNVTVDVGSCTHFARTENDTDVDTSIQQMFTIITNAVFDNKFVVGLQLLNGTNVTFIATAIRDNINNPNDPSVVGGSDLQKFNSTFGFQLNDNLINETKNAISITDCATACIQENVYGCQAFDYQFRLGSCRITSVHPDELNSTNPGIKRNQFSTVYARRYTAEYVQMNAVVYNLSPDKTLTNVQSDELCARACTINSDFICEAFETCDGGMCKLHKTHALTTSPTASTASDCTYYARNHLYDYVRHDNKIIVGHDNYSLNVNDPTVCAQLCATGEALQSCASFEICDQFEGQILCTLSLADPTVQKNLDIEDSMQCRLYTMANSATIKSVNITSTCPTVHSGTSAHTRTTTARTGTATGGHTRSSPRTGTATGGHTRSSRAPAQQSASTSSDTGVRVGIAFGTLILGLIIGAACMMLFYHFRYHRAGVQEDATVLKTWDN